MPLAARRVAIRARAKRDSTGVTELRDAIDLTATPVHLSLGSRARAVDGFDWDAPVPEDCTDAVAEDGAEGRMVMIFEASRPWETGSVTPATRS